MLAKRESLVGSRRITYCTLQEDAREEGQCLGHYCISGRCQPVNPRVGLCGCFSLVVILAQPSAANQPGAPQ